MFNKHNTTYFVKSMEIFVILSVQCRVKMDSAVRCADTNVEFKSTC